MECRRDSLWGCYWEWIVNIKDVAGVFSFVAMIILGFLWIDTRHEHRGEANRARLDSNVFTLNLEVARLTGVKTLYDAKEELEGTLSPTDQSRRAQIILDIQNIKNQSTIFQQQILALP